MNLPRLHVMLPVLIFLLTAVVPLPVSAQTVTSDSGSASSSAASPKPEPQVQPDVVQPLQPIPIVIPPQTQPPVVQPLPPGYQPLPPSQPISQPGLQPSYQPGQQVLYQPGQPSYQPGQPPLYQPGQQPSYQPGQPPLYQPGQQPSYQPGQPPLYQPGQQPSYQPGQPPLYQPGQQPSYQPGQPPLYQPGQQPSYQPGQQPSYQPGQQPTYQPGQQFPYQPGLLPPYQPGQQPPYQPRQQPLYLPGQQPPYQLGQQRPYVTGQQLPYFLGQQPPYQPGQSPVYQPPGYQPWPQTIEQFMQMLRELVECCRNRQSCTQYNEATLQNFCSRVVQQHPQIQTSQAHICWQPIGQQIGAQSFSLQRQMNPQRTMLMPQRPVVIPQRSFMSQQQPIRQCVNCPCAPSNCQMVPYSQCPCYTSSQPLVSCTPLGFAGGNSLGTSPLSAEQMESIVRSLVDSLRQGASTPVTPPPVVTNPTPRPLRKRNVEERKRRKRSVGGGLDGIVLNFDQPIQSYFSLDDPYGCGQLQYDTSGVHYPCGFDSSGISVQQVPGSPVGSFYGFPPQQSGQGFSFGPVEIRSTPGVLGQPGLLGPQLSPSPQRPLVFSGPTGGFPQRVPAGWQPGLPQQYYYPVPVTPATPVQTVTTPIYTVQTPVPPHVVVDPYLKCHSVTTSVSTLLSVVVAFLLYSV